LNISETTPDRAIVTIECELKVIGGLWNGIIFDDLEWPLTRVSKALYIYKSTMSTTVRL